MPALRFNCTGAFHAQLSEIVFVVEMMQLFLYFYFAGPVFD